MSILTISLVTAVFLTSVQCSPRHGPGLAGQWAVGLREDGSSQREMEQKAQTIAQEHGLVYEGPVRIYQLQCSVR